jgi:hypothetical protein
VLSFLLINGYLPQYAFAAYESKEVLLRAISMSTAKRRQGRGAVKAGMKSDCGVFALGG